MKATDARHSRIAMVKKCLPNALTILRMVCAILLLFFRPLSVWFFVLYAIAWLSDILDGYFARRFGASSESGARLDSAADFLLCGVLLFVLIPFYDWPVWVIVWIASIALIRLSALAVCYIRFRQFTFLHTYSNKATGFLLFLSPAFLLLLGLNIAVMVLSTMATISALEEFLIDCTAKEFASNRKSIFTQNNPED